MFVDIGVDGGSEALRHFNYGSTNNSPKGRWEMLGGYGLMVFTAGPRRVHFLNMTWKGYRRICNFVCEHASRMSAPPRLQFFPFSLGLWMIFFRYGHMVWMPFCIRATWHGIHKP